MAFKFKILYVFELVKAIFCQVNPFKRFDLLIIIYWECGWHTICKWEYALSLLSFLLGKTGPTC